MGGRELGQPSAPGQGSLRVPDTGRSSHWPRMGSPCPTPTRGGGCATGRKEAAGCILERGAKNSPSACSSLPSCSVPPGDLEGLSGPQQTHMSRNRSLEK